MPNVPPPIMSHRVVSGGQNAKTSARAAAKSNAYSKTWSPSSKVQNIRVNDILINYFPHLYTVTFDHFRLPPLPHSVTQIFHTDRPETHYYKSKILFETMG